MRIDAVKFVDKYRDAYRRAAAICYLAAGMTRIVTRDADALLSVALSVVKHRDANALFITPADNIPCTRIEPSKSAIYSRFVINVFWMALVSFFRPCSSFSPSSALPPLPLPLRLLLTRLVLHVSHVNSP